MLVVSSSIATACIQAPKRTPPSEIYCSGNINGQEIVQVVLRNYSTFAESGGNCSSALNLPLSIGQVISVQIVYSGTSIPLARFNFSPSQNASFPGSSDYQGLTSAVSTAIAGGLSVDLVFFVIGKEPVAGTCTDVADFFRRTGLIAATDAAGTSGKPTGKHMTVFKSEEVKVGQYDDCRTCR